MDTLALKSKSDIIGIMASLLCLVHCLATPFLFVAQAGLIGLGKTHPQWWGVLDLAFLLASLIAVWWSSENSSKKWIRTVLWSSWILLVIVIL
ncbi:MAG: MerC domain-containing protein, partial [Bacteroidota bacterium]